MNRARIKMLFTYARRATAIALLACAGCGRPAAHACPSADYEIVYEGESRGRGAMHIDVEPGGAVQATLALEVPVSLSQQRLSTQEIPDVQALELRGSGRCVHGKLHLTLGSAAERVADRFTVMGGLLEGMLEPELTEPFGYWRMDIHDDHRDERRKLQGFWHRVATTDAKAASKAAAKLAPAAPDEARAAPAAHARAVPGPTATR